MSNRIENNIHSLIFDGIALLVLAVPAFAQQPAEIDPKAQEFLNQSVTVYAALRSYSCQAIQKQTLTQTGTMPDSRTSRITLAYQNPDHAALALTANGETQQIFTNGESDFFYSPVKKEYQQVHIPAVPGLPKTFDVLSVGMSFIGIILLEPADLSTISGASMLPNTGSIEALTLGPETILDGIAVRTVTKVTNKGKIVYRVTLGVKNHLLYHYGYTVRQLQDPASGASKGVQIDGDETYTDIKLNSTLPAATFLPPAGAKKTSETK